jgi:hypothetical protein
MLVPSHIWNKLWPIIKDMHWKVQNGLVFWFATQVHGHSWEKNVYKMLEIGGVRYARSKPVCLKVFGVFSKFFRKLRDCEKLVGYKGKCFIFLGCVLIIEKFENKYFYGIPFEVMIDIETSFGYYTCDNQEIPGWDNNMCKDLFDWLGKDRY